MGDHALFVDDFLDLTQEPGVVMGDFVNVLDAQPFAHGLSDFQQPVGRALRQFGHDPFARHAFERDDTVEPVEIGFQAAQRLLHRFLEIAPDRHHFADRFHRGG